MSELIDILLGDSADTRNRPLEDFCDTADVSSLLAECAELDRFRREHANLYERVRALFFLHAIHRFHLPSKESFETAGSIPFQGHESLLERRYGEAIDAFLLTQDREGPNAVISSALAEAYHRLAFQTLANQVRRSVRSVRGNQWMFRVGHSADHPLRIQPRLLKKDLSTGLFPIIAETTAVRMDLTHSAWSDIFFLGMDYPAGARVLNISIDLCVHDTGEPRPPVEAYVRVIDEPILRLCSVDLETSAEIQSIGEVFDFAKDYLGLLKAAVIASGIIPPGIESSRQTLEELLARIAGPDRGIEVVSKVNNIPKGSRLAVSTNLLGCLVSACMRATGQVGSLEGPLDENERRIVASRAILGEWIGGSGGGWQDSGGVWPGIKLIEGVEANKDDPEYGVSKGRLLPRHHIFPSEEIPPGSRRKLEESLVLVHGGMAQDVGPILEMVTEKYLLRSASEWKARQDAIRLLDQMIAALKQGNIEQVGRLTQQNFDGPLKAIIPWATNEYTEAIIEQVDEEFGNDFWGFWMLGGMAGGGMGFLFAPWKRLEAQKRLREILQANKTRLESALPFAMDPVTYEFSINENGTSATLRNGSDALLPTSYYQATLPILLKKENYKLTPNRQSELDQVRKASLSNIELAQALIDKSQSSKNTSSNVTQRSLDQALASNGFDPAQHEQIQADIKAGRIGLAQNRLPPNTLIQDVPLEELINATEATEQLPKEWEQAGQEALTSGKVAVVTLAGGAGSRWTRGAGVVKALHPFAQFGGRHRNFLEVHLAKTLRSSNLSGTDIPHVATTSYLTQQPIETWLQESESTLHLSPGRYVGLRTVPTIRDLRFHWEETPQQILDEQAQKMQESLRSALLEWARITGEGTDYRDNLPLQCMHPVGHWYEIPNLLRNGVLARLLDEHPDLEYLLVHNIDTLGTDLSPSLLGAHILSGNDLTFEVIRRNLEDRGGGLAKINGQNRIIEGLAMPHEECEFDLSWYNTLTNWISLSGLLRFFQLEKTDLSNEDRVALAIRKASARMPTYVTLKDVKKRWGRGQEDIFPVAQFEKLWGDMSALSGMRCGYLSVPRMRGQQLKEPAQLDGWLRDGSAAFVDSLCKW